MESVNLVDYSRQREFDEKLVIKSASQGTHIIVGCGGVGFWLGIILAMQGQQNFILIDGQKLEPTNLNRIPCPPSWVGMNKAIALRKVIRSLRPISKVLCVGSHVEVDNMSYLEAIIDRFEGFGGNSLVWDCTDNAVIQNAINRFCCERESEVTYRKIGYEGFTVGTYVEYQTWLPDDYAPGYRTSNACAATSAMAAVMGFMAEGLELVGDINLDIDQLLRSTQPKEELDGTKKKGGK